MDILFKFIGLAMIAAAIFIVFEIPGANKDYQTYGIVGCFLLATAGFSTAAINEKSFSSENLGFVICFILVILFLGIASLLYWNKRKHL
jgi:hypothetical protein